MPLLNTATAVYAGTTAAAKVYAGATEVWSAAPLITYGSAQNGYASQTPSATTTLASNSVGSDIAFLAHGRITGLRYYKAGANVVASHTLRLWDAAGPTQLGIATTSGESGAGWKSALFSSPVLVAAGRVLRVSLDITTSQTVGRNANFGTDQTSGDLWVYRRGFGGSANAYPNTPDSNVYFVDAIFEKQTAPVKSLRLFEGPILTANSAADSANYNFGTEFYVNKAGCYVTKVRYLQPTGLGTLTPRTMALYSTTNGTSGTKVGGNWTMPTPVAGQWCEYTLPSPIALTANLHYRVSCLHPSGSGFARQFFYFDGNSTNSPGNVTIPIGGYLMRPTHGQALNASQGSYTESATVAFPSSAYQFSAYYSDVEVQDVAP